MQITQFQYFFDLIYGAELSGFTSFLEITYEAGAEVSLVFSRKGIDILEITVDFGVQLYVVDLDIHTDTSFKFDADQVSNKWVLNEAAKADLFVHFLN